MLSSPLGATLLRRPSTRAVITAALLLCTVSLTAIATQGDGSVPALVPWLVLWELRSGPI